MFDVLALDREGRTAGAADRGQGHPERAWLGEVSAAASARLVLMPQALRSVMPGLAAPSVACDAKQHPGVAGQEDPWPAATNSASKFWKYVACFQV